MNYTTKIIREVDYKEINKAITNFLKLKEIPLREDYQCVAEEEWSNYESHSIDIEAEADEDEIEQIRKGKFMYQTNNILNWMCAEGLVEEGEYLVSINW
jgi:hypothetical protein